MLPCPHAHSLFRNFPVTPTPNTFSKVLPYKYFLKSTAVQMGGVLQYKWEVYCRTNGRCTAVQMGGVLLGFPFFKA